MSAIANIVNSFSIAYSPGPAAIKAVGSVEATQASDGDRVEISSRARSLSRTAEPSSYSLARLRAIRAEIADGTYETSERIAGTVDRMLDVIG